MPGLFVLAILFGIFTWSLIADKNSQTDPSLMSSALTFVLGSLAGLFIKSPVSQ